MHKVMNNKRYGEEFLDKLLWNILITGCTSLSRRAHEKETLVEKAKLIDVSVIAKSTVRVSRCIFGGGGKVRGLNIEDACKKGFQRPQDQTQM